MKNSSIKEYDEKIASFSGAEIKDDIKTLDQRVVFLKNLGLRTIDDLERKIKEINNLIIKFAEKWIRNKYEDVKVITTGISLFYLCLIILAQESSLDQIIDFLQNVKIGYNPEIPDVYKIIALEIVDIFKEIS